MDVTTVLYNIVQQRPNVTDLKLELEKRLVVKNSPRESAFCARDALLLPAGRSNALSRGEIFDDAVVCRFIDVFYGKYVISGSSELISLPICVHDSWCTIRYIETK